MKKVIVVIVCGLMSQHLSDSFGQPVITQQPQNQSATLGADVTFRVLLSGGAPPYNYQWRFNQAALPQETNDSLLLTNVQLAHAGAYSIVVTDTFEDTVTSDPATLTVDPAFTRIRTGSIATDAAHSFGCAWGDYDNDGNLDLIVANGFGDASVLYHNNGNGTFTRITDGAIATTLGDSDGCVWGDYDNDGNLDLFVANWNLASFLFRNDGNGSFTRIIEGPVGGNVAASVGCAWGDYDGDGFLDLIVANANRQNEFLYRNNGDGTFIQIVSDPITTSGGNSFGPYWLDYDSDGRLDLFMSQGNQIDQYMLFQNSGGGTFSPVSNGVTEGIGGSGDWGDYDNDGDLDLFGSRRSLSGDREAVLFRNDGAGVFTGIPVADALGSLDYGAIWGDYDNDGWLDLFGVDSANHFFRFRNNRDGTLSRVTENGISNDGRHCSGALAWVDYDNDGFLDLFIAAGGDAAAEPNFLYRNNGNSNRWLTVRCVGTASNRSGIGAKVRVNARIDGIARWQLREISGSNGYWGSGLRAHFGLGNATNVDLIRVEWPSGAVQEIENVRVNQILVVKEPTSLANLGMDPFGEVFQMILKAEPGLPYTVEYSTNLIHWAGLTNLTAVTPATQVTDPDVLQSPTRFYRAREGN